MRKLILIWVALLSFVHIAVAHEFNISTHGTLQQTIEDAMSDPNLPDDQLIITTLKITGEIDGKDLAYIHAATGYIGNVQVLDLSEVEIIPTRDWYAEAEKDPSVMYSGMCRFCFDNDYHEEEYKEWLSSQTYKKYQLIFTNDLRYMFQKNKKLREVKFPPCVKAYGNFIFSECSALEHVEANADMQYVGTYAFFECKNLDMTLADAVNWRYVKERAFSGCNGLKGNLRLPKIEKMESGAFMNTSLSSVSVSSSDIIEIPTYCFCGNKSITNVDLSGASSLTIVWDNAFAGNANLSNVSLPEGLLSLEEGAFSNTANNMQMNLPESLVHIGKYNNLTGFEEVQSGSFVVRGNVLTSYTGGSKTSVTSITIPADVKIIQDYVLDGFTNLETITFNEELISIGDENLKSCTKLTNVVVPNNVRYIGHNSFNDCSGMTNITLSSSLKILGKAFQRCTGLVAITLPESLEILRDNIYNGSVFNGCTSLARVTYKAINLQKNNLALFSGCTGISQVIVGNKVESIPSGFLRGLTNVKTVSLPSSLVNIGNYAFYGCSGLTSVTIPDNVVKIGDYAFSNCSGLETVHLSEDLEELGTYSFEKCSALQSVDIPDKVKEISDFAFYQCDALTFVTLGKSVERIGWASLEGSMSSINLPSSVKIIDSYTLTNLTDVYITDVAAYCNIEFGAGLKAPQGSKINLYVNGILTKDLYIPEGVEKLNTYAFYNFDLDLIEIPKSVKTVGNYAFPYTRFNTLSIKDLESWCNCEIASSGSAVNLYVDGELTTNLVIPDGITALPAYAFPISSLKSVTIPNSVKTIGKYCFSNSGIETIRMGNSLETIEESGLFTPSLAQVIMYADVPPIYEGTYNFWSKTLSQGALYVPMTSISDYVNANVWKGFTRIIGFQDCLPEKASSFCNGLNGKISTNAKVYAFSHIKGNNVYGEQVDNNAVEAGKPYIIVPNADAELFTFTPNKKTDVPLTEGLADNNNAMQGVLAEDCDEDKNYKTVADSDYIVFTTEGLRLANSNGTKIKAGKCYINHDNAFAAPAGARAVALGRYLDGDLTGIEAVGNGQTEQGYTINGTKSDGKGLVIYKGRKVLNKKL